MLFFHCEILLGFREQIFLSRKVEARLTLLKRFRGARQFHQTYVT